MSELTIKELVNKIDSYLEDVQAIPRDEILEPWLCYQKILELQAFKLKINVGDIFVKLTRNLMIDVDEEGNIFEIIKVDDVEPVTGAITFTQYEYKKGFIFATVGTGSVNPTFRMVITSNRISDKFTLARRLTTEHFQRFSPEEADALVDRGVKLDIHYCSELKDIKGKPLFTDEEYDMMMKED